LSVLLGCSDTICNDPGKSANLIAQMWLALFQGRYKWYQIHLITLVMWHWSTT